MSGNKAVIALLDRAQLDYAGGKREEAGASLERALRIEPRNPWLWHELAQLRLTQGQYAQAITLAQKSTSFAARERRLLALNWRVIGNARVAQGDSAGAERAFKQAAEFEPAGTTNQPDKPVVTVPGF
jgi:predicted Zn-dependent protease